MKAMVLTAPGVNCDRETVEACRLAGAEVEAVHLNQLLQRDRSLADFGLLIVPGGFSYGDHLGAGAMLASTLRHSLLDEIEQFVADGRLVLGICNGFQILARLGLLGEVALAPNSSGRFICRWVRLRVEPSPCPFLRGLTALELPIAHGEGRVVVPEEREDGPAYGGAMSGAGPQGHEWVAPLRYGENPNGSFADIAGMCNPEGNVFGLMPHPERYLTRYHHPLWTRGDGPQPLPDDRARGRSSPPTGLTIFRNAVTYLEAA